MKQQTGTLTMPDGERLFTYSWLPEGSIRATILISHGFGEHAGRYRHVAETFTGQEYALYAVDHRGNGQSQPTPRGYIERFETLVDDFHRFFEWVRSQQPNSPLYLLMHSMGAAVGLYYVIKYQPAVKGIVATDPYVNTMNNFPLPLKLMVHLLSRIAPRAGVSPRVDASALSHDPAMVSGYDSDPYVFHEQVPARTAEQMVGAGDYVRANLSKITLPMLILQGSMDQIALPEFAKTIYGGIGSKDKTIKIYDGLYHEILNETERAAVMADISTWLAAH